MLRIWLIPGAALCVCFFLAMPPALHAASRTAPAKSSGLGTGYASALATADRFLQAWQTGDIENGIGMLTNRAKGRISREQLEAFFSGSTPAAYEIARGKSLSRGRYEFPVVLMGSSSSAASAKGSHSHRRFSNLVVLHTGNDDWAIDKLP